MNDNSNIVVERFPAFRARPPWWGGDLQTLRTSILHSLGLRRFDLPGEQLELPLGDGSGDRLVGMLNRGQGGRGRPLVVLVHGLTGCSDSSYMVTAARHLAGRGHAVLRLNMRGAGPSAGSCGQRYHAGRGGDIAAALRALDPALLQDGVALVGYSLGGSILLNFLAHHAADFPVRAAVTVSAPIDLAEASEAIHRSKNILYRNYLLDRMKFDWASARLTAREEQALAEIHTIYEFDDRLVAPANGFGTADRYYADCSAARILNRIATPTLLIHAADDPWIPTRAYRAFDWATNPRLTPLLPPSGGHVGFHDRDAPPNWRDRCIEAFFAAH